MYPSDDVAIRVPDIAARPHHLRVEKDFAAAAAVLYEAWTTGFDRWFAAPGSVLMLPRVNTAFFFETEFKAEGQSTVQRHPHYGRFLRLTPDRLVELTWVTGAGGTEGAETIVTVELHPVENATRLRLTHAGFAGEAARDRHRQAWPLVLAQLEQRISSPNWSGES
jgi:uncharacterized protein YndB with AHSA1/START domain